METHTSLIDIRKNEREDFNLLSNVVNPWRALPHFIIMRYKKNRHEPDGLESKVYKFAPNHDQTGKYIPFCDFNYHRGLILDESVCITRECKYYKKLYVSAYEGKPDGYKQ